MRTEVFEAKLAEYIDGVLPPNERAAVEAELAKDPQLAAEVAEIKRLQPMVESLPEAEVPSELTRAIFASTVHRKRAFDLRRLFSVSFFFGPLPAAAVIVFVVVAGLFYFTVLSGPTKEMMAPSFELAKNEPQPLERLQLDELKPVDSPAATMKTKNTVTIPLEGDIKTAGGKKAFAEKGSEKGPLRPAPAMDGLVGGFGMAATSAPDEKQEQTKNQLDLRNDRSGFDQDLSKSEENERDEFAEETNLAPPAPPPVGAAQPSAKLSEEATVVTQDAAPTKRSKTYRAAETEMKDKKDTRKEMAATVAQRWEGQYCGVTKAGSIIVTSDANWKKLWQLIHSNYTEKIPEPTIDFSRYAVVGIFMGMHNTGGFSTKILDVQREDGSLLVTIRETIPQPGQIVTMALTQPYSVVLVPRIIDDLTIEETTPIKVLK